MSIFGAVLGRVLADRKGLPADAANRLMVTGYVLSRATSPAISAVVSDRLAEQEASRLPAPAPSPPSTPPPATQGFVVGNYLGKQYESVAPQLTDAGVFIQRADLNAQSEGGPARKIGEICQIQRRIYVGTTLVWMPMGVNDTFLSGDTILVLVNTGQAMQKVPLVEGLKIENALDTLVEKGFKVEQVPQNVEKFSEDMKKAAAGLVIDQEPEADFAYPEGATVKIFCVAADPGSGGVAAKAARPSEPK